MSGAGAWRAGAARAWALGPGSLRMSEVPRSAGAASTEVERVWAELLRRVPQMFDGPVWAVDAWDAGSGELRCRRSSYKPFACGLAGAPIEEWLLAVTGLVVHRTDDGLERALMGRRGGATWLYEGMWELGPSGGVQPRGAGAPTVEDLRRQLGEELEEETGLRVDCAGAAPVAVCTDPAARSLDVVLRVDVRGPASGDGRVVHPRGEYSEVRWVERGETARFCAEAPGGMIGPTVAALRALGWIG